MKKRKEKRSWTSNCLAGTAHRILFLTPPSIPLAHLQWATSTAVNRRHRRHLRRCLHHRRLLSQAGLSRFLSSTFASVRTDKVFRPDYLKSELVFFSTLLQVRPWIFPKFRFLENGGKEGGYLRIFLQGLGFVSMYKKCWNRRRKKEMIFSIFKICSVIRNLTTRWWLIAI